VLEFRAKEGDGTGVQMLVAERKQSMARCWI
jgi:hypothetical protein